MAEQLQPIEAGKLTVADVVLAGIEAVRERFSRHQVTRRAFRDADGVPFTTLHRYADSLIHGASDLGEKAILERGHFKEPWTMTRVVDKNNQVVWPVTKNAQ